MQAFVNSVGVNPEMNEVKASGGCHGFFKGDFSSGLEKNPDANSTGEFDSPQQLVPKTNLKLPSLIAGLLQKIKTG